MKNAIIRPVYNWRNKLNKHNKAPIHIYVNLNGKRKYLPTNITIEPKEWNEKNLKIRSNNPNHIRLNHQINKMVTQIERLELELHEEGRRLTENQIDMLLKGEGNKDDFIDWAEQQINNDLTVRENTVKTRKSTLKILRDAFGGNKIPFIDVNVEMIEQMNRYMHQQEFKPKTITTRHYILNKLFNMAVKKRMIKRNPYDDYDIKKPPKSLQQTLMPKDVDRIWRLNYPPQSEGREMARLRFLFSCYTGLRFSDTANLKWNDIREGRVILTQQKTSYPVVVPLSLFEGRAEMILEKVKALYQNKEGYVFRNMSSSLTNKHLKVIGQDAKAPFPLHFHISRHTFCTRVASETGSVFKVMELAGITGIPTAQVYINLSKMFAD